MEKPFRQSKELSPTFPAGLAPAHPLPVFSSVEAPRGTARARSALAGLKRVGPFERGVPS